ncbi:MAG: helix-turn-helix transcriptional regulator [Clostridiales bacterium]|jgi:DNA-binding NarL/FixJ family response regulator|nr:helix-turn-helix transcriptional regulator [Clostridiales bacterium]
MYQEYLLRLSQDKSNHITHIDHEVGLRDLTPREKEVVRLICKGLSNKGIADTLFISENTIKRHLKISIQKQGLQTVSQSI